MNEEKKKKEIKDLANRIAAIFTIKCTSNGIKYETIAEELYEVGYRLKKDDKENER